MKRTILSTVLLSLVLLTSCTSTKKKVAMSQPYPEQINWPKEYDPKDAGFFAHNEIDIKAPPEKVWDILL
ncbi:hypothetical protein LV716_09575 [Flagellimonas sp. HMM57]|uniref:hypothetical protein n=1 Tax=unclassified Flagellimonas TaxID=2644544 RepID=UPI0013D00F27|nr:MULTISPECIES: hypothetical protein [unclassified Flagellimonas]UII74516.1 hypothetical protein LV716_09575 [Flagellimonas sp. HMM57]